MIATQKAGMTIAPSLVNSGIILINFFFGVVVFQEPLYSVGLACLSIVVLIGAIVVMVVFSKEKKETTPSVNLAEDGEKLLNGKHYLRLIRKKIEVQD